MEDEPTMDLEELEKECEVSFTKTGGPGGQHRNKAETAVRVTHRPTGITVVASDQRSQYRNRIAALERLAEQLEQMEEERRAAERRRRRRRTRRTRRSEEKRLKGKKARGRLKQLRRRIRGRGEE
jgi:protein subunit release factor B